MPEQNRLRVAFEAVKQLPARAVDVMPQHHDPCFFEGAQYRPVGGAQRAVRGEEHKSTPLRGLAQIHERLLQVPLVALGAGLGHIVRHIDERRLLVIKWRREL